jgi:Leucine-rich repeat (LRR) protein
MADIALPADIALKARDIALPKARALFESARSTKLLHLSSLALRAIPGDVWPLAQLLVRLDLSYNCLSSIPQEISLAIALEQLWLNDNALLAELPPKIEFCKKLKVRKA